MSRRRTTDPEPRPWAAGLFALAVAVGGAYIVYRFGAVYAGLASLVGAGGAVFALVRGRTARVVAVLALCPLPVVALWARQKDRDDEAPEERALALEHRADRQLFVARSPEAAAPLYRQSDAVWPTFPARHKLGLSALLRGHEAEAIAAFEAALAAPERPDDPRLYAQGIAWLKGGQRELGLAAIERAYHDRMEQFSGGR